MTTTVIRNAAWMIAWDEGLRRHTYRRNVDLAFTDDGIAFIGRDFAGPADRVIDGSARLVMPGLIDIHSHPEHEPLYRGIREEHGLPSMHMTGLYERSQALSAPDDEARVASAEFAYCELLLSGVTSLVDISPPWPGWVELFAKSGLRGFLAPGYASAGWYLEDDHELHYAWDEARGRAGFAAALTVIDTALGHNCGRLSGVVSPMQIDTCTADLLRDSHAAAKERGLPFTVHVAQSVTEVREMIRRHGQTPVQWAASLGILGPGTILGHALYLDRHSWIRWHTNTDLALLGDSGTAVAHCPTPFARYGHVMESFGDYLRAGVVMGLGTDCAPHNLVEEMRKAAVLARIAARDITSVSTADLFHAATAGGASALLRDDLGRLAPGCKADLVLLDLACPQMQPARDPLRSFVYHAADRAVREVFVDGRQVVADGRVQTLDREAAGNRLRAAQERMEALAPSRDYRRRSAAEITPLSLPVAD
ncbi:MAG TPA: amidohydrolase family protein [Stellaceae bacterium]|jgi:cytosine/adenosine deaminase-related metal-dependent hydrolase|nr:amidohydrolase family protein [Stellaceae bacterium]